MIKAILIDVDNTLLDFHLGSRVIMQQLFDEYNYPFTEEIYKTYIEVNDILWAKYELGEVTREEIYATRWKTVFQKLEIGIDSAGFEAKYLEGLKTSAEKVEGADEIMAYLSSKYPVYVGSNATQERQELRLAKAGLTKYISDIYTSEKLGASKPSEEFFEICLKNMGDLKPEEVMVIGDSITADINGGRACGMKTCWFNFEGTEVPEDLKTDFVVYNLHEIKSII